MVKHRIVVSDNGSCEETQELYENMGEFFPLTVIKNGENIGTARAINRGWSLRKPGEHAVKMDNDCVVNHSHWADEMEEVFERDPSIGICGLKRKDLEERPDHQCEHYRSTLRMLPHQPGQRWIVVEEVNHVLGTCQGYSSALLEKIGYLYQGQDQGISYAFDDVLASFRARMADFRVVFLPYIDMDHIDPGGTDYTEWKQKVAGEKMTWLSNVMVEYRMGKRPLYWKDSD
jgi:GT2 family glycosyltransferase